MTEWKIHENCEQHFPEFLNLNRIWIEKYFEFEECDRRLEKEIYERAEKGDQFFTLTIDDDKNLNNNSAASGRVVGCCAFFNTQASDGLQIELARMAVDPDFQGQGIGKRILDYAISRAVEIRPKKFFLMTNTALETAVRMYRRRGFVDCQIGPSPDYGRCNLVMEWPFEESEDC